MIYEFLGLGVNDFWVAFFPCVAAIMLGSLLSGWLAGRVSPQRAVSLGFSLMPAAAWLNVLQGILLAPAPLNVVAPLAFYVLGMALAMPGLKLMALDCFPKSRGMASAMLSFIQMAFTALIVGAVVPLVAVAVVPLALTMLVLSCVALLLWKWLLQQSGESEVAAVP